MDAGINIKAELTGLVTYEMENYDFRTHYDVLDSLPLS